MMPRSSDSEGLPVRENPMEERLRINLELFVKQSGYSVTQIADLAGMAQASLARYVRGDNAIPADILKPLADVFGRSVADFYERTPPPPPTDLQALKPGFLKPRPGVQFSEEDLADFEDFLVRVQTRRAKRPPPKKR